MAPRIEPLIPIMPMIYAYTTPGYPAHDGWLKIGMAEKQTVEERVREQLKTADIDYRLEWRDFAFYKDGSQERFRDTDFHAWLVNFKNVVRKVGREWFQIEPAPAKGYFDEFALRQYQTGALEKAEYSLRSEQAEAVEKTLAHFQAGGKKFLWNAKPRFGKTLAAYDLIRKMPFKNALILTNRPSIGNSWLDDFRKFIAWRGECAFISDNAALAGKGVYTRTQYEKTGDSPKRVISFQSLQALKNSQYFGGDSDTLEWMAKVRFDLVIIDESHEGVDTAKTEFALDELEFKHLLYLSGTPFRQLASNDFSDSEIFNWAYSDEQAAKRDWRGEEANPYEALPQLNLFTYRMSGIAREKAARGIELADGENYDYAFDLNDFFETRNGRFVHAEAVRNFIKALHSREKFPFSTPELRETLAHTLWHLHYVESAKALKRMLEEDEVFKDYEIILAVGDGSANGDGKTTRKALDRVREAVNKPGNKSITLTVGQLTVGITVPQWTGALMLSNMASPSAYMQAAFRVQTPWESWHNGRLLRKENAYVFDFDPARTLEIYDKFASNLSGAGANPTAEERRERIKELLNFLPVIGEDENGEMVKLDAEAVLSIPRRLKSQTVLECRFMSNLLFENIGNIFGAPEIVAQILEKLRPVKEFKMARGQLDGMEEISLNQDGQPVPNKAKVIGLDAGLFGPKIYAISEETQKELEKIINENPAGGADRKVIEVVAQKMNTELVGPVAGAFGRGAGARKGMERRIRADLEKELGKLNKKRDREIKIAKSGLERKNNIAQTPTEIRENESDFEKRIGEIAESHKKAVCETVKSLIDSRHAALVEEAERTRLNGVKREKEEEIRSHLRGFARAIPAFLMAYGRDDTCLENFDSHVDVAVFEEVTGITLENFRFLRDGGEYVADGQTKTFRGQVFDKIVFNDSIRAFMAKRRELANYFDESQERDIFDYIPPQRTNQIYTPREVVIRMLDLLEAENPGCFDDPQKTFADLYMKSGLYIAEIIKRLYRGQGLKKAFPNNEERLRHIIERQVYGLAPSEIIYRVATNFILGFDEKAARLAHNFRIGDALAASREGRLEELVEKCFEKPAT